MTSPYNAELYTLRYDIKRALESSEDAKTEPGDSKGAMALTLADLGKL